MPNPELGTQNPKRYLHASRFAQEAGRNSGDFGRRVTPVPIPNTAVKPPSAYGTARLPGGRVGRRRNSFPLPDVNDIRTTNLQMLMCARHPQGWLECTGLSAADANRRGFGYRYNQGAPMPAQG